MTEVKWPEPTENSHIPGPWEARRVRRNWTAICPVGYATVIAEQYDSNDKALSPRDWANACLLAAAPELLEALNHINQIASFRPYADDSVARIKYVARAAIAKATGGAA